MKALIPQGNCSRTITNYMDNITAEEALEREYQCTTYSTPELPHDHGSQELFSVIKGFPENSLVSDSRCPSPTRMNILDDLVILAGSRSVTCSPYKIVMSALTEHMLIRIYFHVVVQHGAQVEYLCCRVRTIMRMSLNCSQAVSETLLPIMDLCNQIKFISERCHGTYT